jgi:hypothetical protein
MYAIRQGFRAQFPDLRWDYWVSEIFTDHVIVQNDVLPADEYYYVTYERDEDEGYVFADRNDWEVVELTYQLQMVESKSKEEGGRLVESVAAAVRLLDEGEDVKPEGPWRIAGVGITAGVVNENGRRYSEPVIDAAVHELRTHLHESAGQGRVQQLYGEAEHPSMKAARRPFLPEVTVNWDRVHFDGRQVLLEGNLLGTARGKDIRAQMLGGVVPGISQRAYGESHVVEEDGQEWDEVDWVVITGYDLTVEPSDPVAGVTMYESKKKQQEDETVELNLEKLRADYPELVRQIEESHDANKKRELEEALAQKAAEDAATAALVAQHETDLRETMGLGVTDDLTAAVAMQKTRLAELEEAEQTRAVAEFVEAEIGKIKGYPGWLQEQMATAVGEAGPKTVEEATQVIVGKRKEYDGIMAKIELAAQGYEGGAKVLGAVLERGTGTPDYALPAFLLQESMRKQGLTVAWNPKKPKNANERFAALVLERFDKRYGHHLRREAKEYAEAEQTSDLNLPYSVSRAIIAEAFPMLVATSIFDVGVISESPTRLYYETFAGETGYTATVTDEAVTSDESAWVAMANKRLTPGTVVVTGSGGTPTYTEDTDYLIDIANGELYTLSTGSIGDATTLEVDYTYTAIRKGEMATIERGKQTLTYVTVEAAADRLAQQVSDEAVVFSASQLGWDATARTLMSLVQQIRRKIDQGMLYMALAVVGTIASNSGGTWINGTDTLDDLVEKIGVAKVLVANRFYIPTAIVVSVTTGDILSNWDGFKRDGFPSAVLDANGFVGRVKGLPVFESTEFTDSKIVVCNRELVMHRVFQAMMIKGPFPSYDATTAELIAAEQYYAEEYNLTEAPVPEKGAYVTIA